MNAVLIKSQDCIDLRSRILRPNQRIELCHFDEDNFESTFHLGVFKNDQIISNGTFMLSTHSYFSKNKNVYRLRGMATDPAFQRQGQGRLILEKAEDILKGKNCEILWFNARESAFGFYEKCGYKKTGDMFDIADVGPHKVMFKKLF
jgi:GNAT superfamily N-acetyltransferase